MDFDIPSDNSNQPDFLTNPSPAMSGSAEPGSATDVTYFAVSAANIGLQAGFLVGGPFGAAVGAFIGAPIGLLMGLSRRSD